MIKWQMKISNLFKKISVPFLGFLAGCMPLQTTGYVKTGAGFLKPESRKATAQVSTEIGAETTFDNDRKLRTGIRYRFLPHPSEKQNGVTADLDSHLYSAHFSTPIVDNPRFKLYAGIEGGIIDTRGTLSTEPFPGLELQEEYNETSGFVGASLQAEYGLTRNISVFGRPEIINVFTRDGNESSYGASFGLKFDF